MPRSTPLFRPDPSDDLSQGSIYRYRPVIWLEPPLWLVRETRWTEPVRARLQRWDQVSDAFRRGEQQNQEDVLARAKVRFVIVLSNDIEAGAPEVHQVKVAPTYTLHPDSPAAQQDAVRHNQLIHTFYLPRDNQYPHLGECYINFRLVRPLHKGFLDQSNKLEVSLTRDMMDAILESYIGYLRTQPG